MFTKFLCWYMLEAMYLWTCVSILENLLLLFYIFFIFVFQINIFFNSIQFRLTENLGYG